MRAAALDHGARGARQEVIPSVPPPPPPLLRPTDAPGCAPPSVPLRLLRLRSQATGRVRECEAILWGVLPGARESGARRWRVCWRAPAAAPLPSAGALVQVALGAAGLAAVQRGTDPVTVQRLWSLPRVQPGVNLLHTVPVHWLPSEPLQGLDVSHAFALLWARLPEALRAWFNAIFWEHPQRLWAFLHAPASLAHHHACRHGLLRHSLECALQAARLSRSDPEADPGVLLLAALLHDVGKAGEYEAWLGPRAHADPRGPQRAGLSLRGELLGHRLTGLEWMAQARARLPATLAPSEAQALAVYHAIHACHAPAWVGLRSPRTPEAHYLASVDALSGHLELMERLWRQGRAQGVRHPALQGRQYWPRHTLA